MALIKDRQVATDDPWILVDDGDHVPSTGDVIVGLHRFLADESELRARAGRFGVRIDPTDELDELATRLDGVALVAIHFPKFADGRGYTKARLLRERYGFEGEMRAVGDVLADQLYYMQRCGIDTFDLKQGKNPELAIACLSDLSVRYQGAVDEREPLYRRGR